MHRIAAFVVLAVVTVAGAPALLASDAMKAIVGSYLEIQQRLASDKIDGVKAAAGAIAVKAGEMGASGAPLAKAAKAVGEAADLKAAREAFGPLSDAVIAAASAEGELKDVKVAFCPMNKRSWVQKEEKIRNPYYGSLMLECGDFKK